MDTQTQATQMHYTSYISRKAGLELEYSNAIECLESWKAADPESLMIEYNQRRLDTARDALNELEHEYYGEWYGYSNTMRSVGKVY